MRLPQLIETVTVQRLNFGAFLKDMIYIIPPASNTLDTEHRVTVTHNRGQRGDNTQFCDVLKILAFENALMCFDNLDDAGCIG